MRYLGERIVFQEIPDEISLSLQITGCSLRCTGCHSPELWNPESGRPLSTERLEWLITTYGQDMTNVLFMGGDWHAGKLRQMAQIIRSRGFKVSLYTGLTEEQLPQDFWATFDYLKVGPYRKELGGLQSSKTNQRLYETKTRTILNHYFLSKEDEHGQTERSANR